MKITIKDAATVITTITLTVGLMSFGAWKAEREVEEKKLELAQAAIDGRAWMDHTTAQLETIADGIERITSDTIELAIRIDGLSTRLDTLEATQ